jgi:hypothetical protein
MFPENGGTGLMQLEESCVVEITKVMDCVDSNGDPLIQILECTNTIPTQQCCRQLEVSRENYTVEQDK